MRVLQNDSILNWTIKNEGKDKILKALSKNRQIYLEGRDRNDNTLLHFVLANKKLSEKEIIKLLAILLNRGSDVNAENKEGKAAIHFAVKRKLCGVVELLTRRKADINKRNKQTWNSNAITHDFVQDEINNFEKLLKFDGRVPDSRAEEIESASFAEFMVKVGFDFDLQNEMGQSAFHMVLEDNLQHILHVLVKHTRNVHFYNHERKSLLQLFMEKNVQCRRESCRDKSKKLWYSEYSSRYAAGIVRTLLKRGVSTCPHERNPSTTCLQSAIKHGEDTSVIELLVEHRLKGTRRHSATRLFAELLRTCAWWDESRTKDFLKILRKLMFEGADVNGKDRSGTAPIHRAVHGRNRYAVEFLNYHGADFRARNDSGESLLHTLAKKGPYGKQTTDECSEGLFDYLAGKNCCDVNARNSTRETPLHWAVRCENLTIAKKLIDNGAEVNCKDESGNTPLHHAVRHGVTAGLVELLLESGAHVNCKDKWGRRPLFFAASAPDKRSLVTTLLERGAYVNARNEEESPFWEAIRCRRFGHVNQMLAYGAHVNDDEVAVSSFLESLTVSAWESGASEKFVLQHWAKLKVANLPYPKELEGRDEVFFRQEVYKDCLKEIEKLKCFSIDSRTSIYRFLHMDFGGRRSHMNSEKLRQLVESPDLEKQFPNYSVVILASYRETVMWKSLLEPAKLAWLRLTGFPLPGECLEPIFTQLTNEDLINMIEYEEDL